MTTIGNLEGDWERELVYDHESNTREPIYESNYEVRR